MNIRATTVLVVDIGNSQTKVAWFQQSQCQLIETFPTEKSDLDLYQKHFLTHVFKNRPCDIEAIVVSSVVPALKPILADLFLHNIGSSKQLLWIERSQLLQLNMGGLDLSHYAPGELGTDRAMGVFAAHQLYHNQNVLVCSLGTTATFDLLNAQSTYLGGAIAPGPEHFQSLTDAKTAAQLFQVDLFQPPSQSPGVSTETSLQNGLYYGYQGLVQQITHKLIEQAHWDYAETQFVVTGGKSQSAQTMLTAIMPNITIEPQLVLKGLNLLWKLNNPALRNTAELS